MDSKSNKSIWLILSGVILALFVVGYAFMPAEDQKATEKVSKQRTTTNKEREYPPAPEFALQDMEGNIVKLSDHKGKVVFVNFWATWCPPCRAEIPYFIQLMEQYNEDFIVLGISVDNPRDIPKVPAFAEDFEINYPVLFADSKTVGAYGGIRSIPTTFVVDKEGNVVGRIVGSRPKSEFEQIIKDLL